MKAKEHYAKYAEEVKRFGPELATSNMVMRLFEETQELIKIRNCIRPSAVISVHKEICNKWNAICKFDQALQKDGLMELLVAQAPEEIKAKIREALK